MIKARRLLSGELTQIEAHRFMKTQSSFGRNNFTDFVSESIDQILGYK